ncbi:MAG: DUF1538 domain-containing protein [Treponema sp.]|jgi:hypothetical protein|nr:DUF1538 domain-containing protein [Treponema sp.]
MNKVLWEKIREAFSSVLPITAIVLVASVVLEPLPTGTILMFVVGAALLIIGMGFFTLGADMAMMPMGEGIGVQLTRSTSLVLTLAVSLIMGVIITVSEPDLQVLAAQVPSIPNMALILTVAAGVGLFLVIAFLPFTPSAFIPVAFDSGGVTTGPMTVPFILALGVGVASVRGDKGSSDDSFGLVSLCSIGPILAVLLLGIFYHPEGAQAALGVIDEPADSRDVVVRFIFKIPEYIKEVCIALAAIVIFFLIFQLFSRRYKRRQIGRIFIGFLYTFIGLVVFLTGVNVGFIPVGQMLGTRLAASAELKWVLVPLGVVIGYFIVAAEPAVHVLNKQVEEISAGAIPQKVMKRGLSVGMSIALGITMLRILLKIPIMYILVPGYAFAILLTFFVPKMFTGIAFDSGGVCSGPMTSTFLLPLAMGACAGSGGDMMRDAFGIVAMVAMTPLVIIQLMGVMYQMKVKTSERRAALAQEALSEAVSAVEAGSITEFADLPGSAGGLDNV